MVAVVNAALLQHVLRVPARRGRARITALPICCSSAAVLTQSISLSLTHQRIYNFLRFGYTQADGFMCGEVVAAVITCEVVRSSMYAHYYAI
jgi:hypothetical protein